MRPFKTVSQKRRVRKTVHDIFTAIGGVWWFIAICRIFAGNLHAAFIMALIFMPYFAATDYVLYRLDMWVDKYAIHKGGHKYYGTKEK